MKQNFFTDIITGNPTKKQLQVLINLYSSIFEDAQINFFIERIKQKKDVLSIIAYEDDIPIGFKIGYQYNQTIFYSWIGGVLPKYRKRKVASTLAFSQEKWAKKKGYSKLRTKSMNRFKPMLIFNLKNGFDIIQVYTNESKQTKIVFEKRL
ncbi:GNAT family N-acetyltransferase [Tenacibaculum sp. nBUS_03]|uniref:GNAT family N-acetyltransferase n=1 Tax=Tenacibaculum sp. nBUS_03 TaxID=3395320 RepID=UPI003EC10890